MGTVLVQILGVLGFFLAVSSFVWCVWSYLTDRREDIRVSTSYCRERGRRYDTIRVTAWNKGRIPAYVSEARLEYELDEPAHLLSDGRRIKKVSGSIRLAPDGEIEHPLQAGNRATFALLDCDAPLCKSISQLPPEKVHVAVYTGSGKRYRLSGETVHSMVRSIVKSVEEQGHAG